MSAHTPDQWFVEHGSLRILSDDPRTTIICVVSGSESNPQARADARLISAGPELLRAAKEAESDLAWIEKTVPNSNFQSSLILLRAAIAKATKP